MRTGSGENNGREEAKFHYDREQRLKRFHRSTTRRRSLRVGKKRRRNLLIIFIDLLIIALVYYLINRPANVYLEKEERDVSFELNVTGIRGKKILVGFSIRNSSEDNMSMGNSKPVQVKILPRNGEPLTFEKNVEGETVLLPGESISTIFLFNEEDLPGWATLEIYYGSDEIPIFTRNIRF
jgi:hypothetical protein